VFAGVFDLAEGLTRPDNVTGVTLGAELKRIGFAGPEAVGGRPVAAYFEAHIEQGPILEAAGLPIGVVTGAQGQRWITVSGQEAQCRADTDAAEARRVGRCGADDRRGQPHRPCPRALRLRDRRVCAGQPGLAQHDPRPGVLYRRLPPSRRRGAEQDAWKR
jgi:hypothetical protein